MSGFLIVLCRCANEGSLEDMRWWCEEHKRCFLVILSSRRCPPFFTSEKQMNNGQMISKHKEGSFLYRLLNRRWPQKNSV